MRFDQRSYRVSDVGEGFRHGVALGDEIGEDGACHRVSTFGLRLED